MRPRVVVALAVAVGVAAGWLAAAPTRGHDAKLAAVRVSADGRTIAIGGGDRDTLTVEETSTEVRLRRHVGFGLPSTSDLVVITVHLRAPLGGRRLVDAVRPAGPAPLAPAWLPAGFAPAGSTIDFAADRRVLTYTSPDGGLITVTDEPAASPSAGTGPPGAYLVMVNGRAVTVTALMYGFRRLDPGDLARVGDSVR